MPGQARPEAAGLATTQVLIVEDDEVQQALIKQMLRQCVTDVQTQVCADGAAALEALEALAGRTPDLVVLDLALPDIDGRTVLATLQRDHPRLPVLVYSGDREALAALASEANQALAVLSKDSGVEAFTRLVPTLFKRRNSDRADRPQRVPPVACIDARVGQSASPPA